MSHEILSQMALFKLLLFPTHLYQFEKSPLLAAIEGGHTGTAQLLIDKGAGINKATHVSALNIVAHNFLVKIRLN